jgi:hypothetical protein
VPVYPYPKHRSTRRNGRIPAKTAHRKALTRQEAIPDGRRVSNFRGAYPIEEG